MILSMSGQAWLFLSTVVAGFAIGLFYDLFRITRKTVRHKAWLVQIEDVLYWSVASVLMFYFLLQRNHGEIRFFIIIGAAVGMISYFYTLSPLIVKVSVAVISFFKRVLFTVARILLVPIRMLIKLLKILAKPFIWLAKYIRGKMYFVKRGSRNRLRSLRRSARVVLKKV